MSEDKSDTYEIDAIEALSEDAGDLQNDVRTCEPRDTGLTQARSGDVLDFSFEETRRNLIHKREHRYGADSPKGHACSNLIEQMQCMRTYVRPAWATHDSQTLPHMMALQMKRLARHNPADRNIDDLRLQRLRQVLDYNPVTGALTWRFRLSPNCKIGEPAGQVNKDGYRKIRLDGKYYHGSHLAWFHYHGTPPTGLLDHKNRNKSDDSIENLRPATYSQNSMNQGRNSANTTGFKGVAVFNKPGKPTRYRALIRVNKKRIFLGIFDTPEEAYAMYCAAAKEHHGEFARVE